MTIIYQAESNTTLVTIERKARIYATLYVGERTKEQVKTNIKENCGVRFHPYSQMTGTWLPGNGILVR